MSGCPLNAHQAASLQCGSAKPIRKRVQPEKLLNWLKQEILAKLAVQLFSCVAWLHSERSFNTQRKILELLASLSALCCVSAFTCHVQALSTDLHDSLTTAELQGVPPRSTRCSSVPNPPPFSNTWLRKAATRWSQTEGSWSFGFCSCNLWRLEGNLIAL